VSLPRKTLQSQSLVLLLTFTLHQVNLCTELRENVLRENVLPCSSAALRSRNLRRAERKRSSVVSPTPMKPRTGRVSWSAFPFSKINAEYPPLEPRFLAVSKMSRNKLIHKKKSTWYTVYVTCRYSRVQMPRPTEKFGRQEAAFCSMLFLLRCL
jgi:hypothetical protein